MYPVTPCGNFSILCGGPRPLFCTMRRRCKRIKLRNSIAMLTHEALTYFAPRNQGPFLLSTYLRPSHNLSEACCFQKSCLLQGCQIFLGKIYHYGKIHPYQITLKYTKWPQNMPNGIKIYQMATKYTRWPQNIPNGSKIYQMAVKYTTWT
jgi:hypothetical protein